MKLTLLALSCAGTAALCQSTAQPRVDPDKLFQLPDSYLQAPDPGRSSSVTGKLRMPFPKPKTIFEVPPAHPASQPVDPRMIVRPPWPKNDRAKGKDVAKDLYPNLKYLPVRHRQPGSK